MSKNKSKKRYKDKIIRRRRVVAVVVLSLVVFIGAKLYSIINNKSEVLFLKNLTIGTYKINKLKYIQEEYENNLDIKVIDYDWREDFKEINNPKYLVYHHTDSNNVSAKDIHKTHIEKGWGGIGYHFYIRKDGTIYRGRPEEVIGAHVYGKNRDTLGICLEGNFEKEEPSNEQIDSLVKLSADMIMKYNIEDLMGHRDLYNTLCPGKEFDLDEIKNMVSDELIELLKK